LNRLKIILLLFLFSLQSVFSPNLFAEVVTQSFDGNRRAVMPGVLLTRLVNTGAFNYHQKNFKVKHLETTFGAGSLERARDTESIKNDGNQLLVAMVFGENSSKPDYGFEISGGKENITFETAYPSNVTGTRDRNVSMQSLNLHLGSRLSIVGLDNLGLGLVYHNTQMEMKTTTTNTATYFSSNEAVTSDVDFSMLGWNLMYNLPKTLFFYDFFYLSVGATNTTFSSDSTLTSSVTTIGKSTNETTSMDGGGTNSSKMKDYVGGAAILTEKYRAEYYHFLRYNPTGDEAMFTEQSQSQIDKIEIEAIFGAPEFLHFLGEELYFSGFFVQDINSMIMPQDAATSLMFGTDTKWSILKKNGIHLGFSPSTGMSYGLGFSQEEFEWAAYDLGDRTKTLREKEVSGQVVGLGIGYNW
jgi:hypothetical protein